LKALERYNIIRPHFEDGVCQTELARVHHRGLTTVQRWIHDYREGGLAGLMRKSRSDKGGCRGLPELLVLLIEGLALQTLRRPFTTIHALVSQIAQEQHWPGPSYEQVYRIVRRLPPDLLILGQEGVAAYEQAFDLLFCREAPHANAIWQADHCRLRLFLKDERGKVGMPLLTAIMDDYSRGLAGYRLGWSGPSALQTGLTLRDAIRVKADACWLIYGVPESFYTDHGSDFTSKHLEAVAADLKMSLIFSLIGRPRGRGKIERFFRTLREEVLSKLPGYAPKVKDNPRLQRAIEAEAREVACLTLAEFEEIFRAWLLNTYHMREHSETNASPQGRWLNSTGVPVLPEDDAQLNLLLMQLRVQRVVYPEGIRYKGAWYMHSLLAGYVREGVIIRYDPLDMARLWVYEVEQGERLICQAQCVERGGEAVSLSEVEAERAKRRKAVGKALQERKKVVARYASPEQLG
jgi:putative transposase